MKIGPSHVVKAEAVILCAFGRRRIHQLPQLRPVPQRIRLLLISVQALAVASFPDDSALLALQ